MTASPWNSAAITFVTCCENTSIVVLHVASVFALSERARLGMALSSLISCSLLLCFAGVEAFAEAVGEWRKERQKPVRDTGLWPVLLASLIHILMAIAFFGFVVAFNPEERIRVGERERGRNSTCTNSSSSATAPSPSSSSAPSSSVARNSV